MYQYTYRPVFHQLMQCVARPANGCTQYSRLGNSAHPPGRLHPVCKTFGNGYASTADHTRETCVIGSYIENILPGLIRLKTLAGGRLCNGPTKTKRAIFLHFGGESGERIFEIKNKQPGDPKNSYRAVYNFSIAKLDEPTKRKNPQHSTLSIANFLINFWKGKREEATDDASSKE